MKEVLLDLGARLASLAKIVESKDEGDVGNEKLRLGVMAWLESISQKVASWEVGQSMIWDSGTDDGKDYLKMVDEVRRLVERFEGLNLSKDSEEYEILRKANDILQTSMTRVEEELKHMLAHNRQNFEPERLSFRSTEDDSLDDSSRFSFGDESVDDSIQRDNASPAYGEDSSNDFSSLCPMGLHFRSLMSLLESNLEEKSRLYKEDALGHLFLMNNIHYMAEKVKGSELRNVLGDNWIRKRNWKFQHYAMSYERSTWSSILSLLRDEGLHHSGHSGLISKTLLKERLQMFYTAFEEISKTLPALYKQQMQQSHQLLPQQFHQQQMLPKDQPSRQQMMLEQLVQNQMLDGRGRSRNDDVRSNNALEEITLQSPKKLKNSGGKNRIEKLNRIELRIWKLH
ncbi:exocyst complex component EXO70E2-like protein [Tanacetum coccineum]